MNEPAGYGLSREPGRWQRWEIHYELWQTEFPGLLLLGLMDAILREADDGEEDENEEAYAESFPCYERTRGWWRKVLEILREHYAGKGTPPVISLYAELTSLQKGTDDSVTSYYWCWRVQQDWSKHQSLLCEHDDVVRPAVIVTHGPL